MAHKIYIGIDNGITGTIGWVGDAVETGFIETPKFSEQSYTKKKGNISRIKHLVLKQKFIDVLGSTNPSDVLVILERPLVNPGKFKASISGVRALEATLCVIEDLGFPRMYADSKDWQKVLLPKGTRGSDELKKASLDIGCRLFPQFTDVITDHGDADGILIAEWARRAGL